MRMLRRKTLKSLCGHYDHGSKDQLSSHRYPPAVWYGAAPGLGPQCPLKRTGRQSGGRGYLSLLAGQMRKMGVSVQAVPADDVDNLDDQVEPDEETPLAVRLPSS